MSISRREWATLLVRGSIGCWVGGHLAATGMAATAEALSHASSEGSLGNLAQVQGSVDELLDRILNDPDRRESYEALGAACLRSLGGRERPAEEPARNSEIDYGGRSTVRSSAKVLPRGLRTPSMASAERFAVTSLKGGPWRSQDGFSPARRPLSTLSWPCASDSPFGSIKARLPPGSRLS